jgi:hypothetical protein
MLSRTTLAYDARSQLAAGGFDPDVPTPGFYRTRLRKGAHPVAIHIFYGQTPDPETGEPLERWAWQARINGKPVDLYSVWPGCARDPISKAEHDHLVKLELWGREHAPDSPQANPLRPINHLTAPLPF